MGFSYYLERGFRESEWEKHVQKILSHWSKKEKILPLTWHFHDAIGEPEDFSVAATEQGPALILRDGGVRGAGILAGAEEIEVAIQSMGSRADWEAARQIVAAARECGASVRSDNSDDRPLDDPEAFSDEQIEKDYREFSEFSYKAIRKVAGDGGDGPVKLPVQIFAHMVSREEILATQSAREFEDLLAERTRRYGNAFWASLMQVAKDGGKNYSISFYYPGGSVIRDETQLVGFLLNDGEKEEMIEVPTGSAKAILREQIEDLGKAFFIPSIDFNAEPILLEALQRAAEKDPWPEPLSVSEADTPAGASSQTDGLKRAPMLAFLCVAGADGRIDAKELRAFAALLESVPEQEESAFFDALQRLRADFQETAKDILGGGGDEPFNPFLELEETAGWIEANLPEEEAILFKEGLHDIAQTVAEAEASGGFFGFGKKIGKQEAAALEALVKAIGYPPE